MDPSQWITTGIAVGGFIVALRAFRKDAAKDQVEMALALNKPLTKRMKDYEYCLRQLGHDPITCVGEDHHDDR